MTCAQFQTWFARLLEEEAPPDFPAEAYRRHLVACERCRIALSLPDYEAKVGEIASTLPSRVSEETCARIVASARRLAVRRRWTVRLEWAAVILILAGAAFALRPRPDGAPCEPCRETTTTAAAGLSAPEPEPEKRPPPPIEEVARRLQASGFEFASARQARADRNLLLLYTRTDETADPYAFARSVALSDCASLYPDAPLLTVTIQDEKKKAVMRAQFPTDDLAEKGKDPDLLLLSGRDFCLKFKLLYERPGLSNLRGE